MKNVKKSFLLPKMSIFQNKICYKNENKNKIAKRAILHRHLYFSLSLFQITAFYMLPFLRKDPGINQYGHIAKTAFEV